MMEKPLAPKDGQFVQFYISIPALRLYRKRCNACIATFFHVCCQLDQLAYGTYPSISGLIYDEFHITVSQAIAAPVRLGYRRSFCGGLLARGQSDSRPRGHAHALHEWHDDRPWICQRWL